MPAPSPWWLLVALLTPLALAVVVCGCKGSPLRRRGLRLAARSSAYASGRAGERES